MGNYSTIKDEGYKYVACIGTGEHIIENEDGKRELWMANKNHASRGLIFKNTHLEFVRTALPEDLARIL